MNFEKNIAAFNVGGIARNENEPLNHDLGVRVLSLKNKRVQYPFQKKNTNHASSQCVSFVHGIKHRPELNHAVPDLLLPQSLTRQRDFRPKDGGQQWIFVPRCDPARAYDFESHTVSV